MLALSTWEALAAVTGSWSCSTSGTGWIPVPWVSVSAKGGREKPTSGKPASGKRGHEEQRVGAAAKLAGAGLHPELGFRAGR